MREKILKRQIIAAVIMAVVTISVVFLGTRGTAQNASPTCTEMASIYLEIAGMDGEATIGPLTGQIEVLRYSHGVLHLGRGSTDLQPITIVKLVDKTTPKLYEKSAKGEVLPFAFLRVYRGCPESDPVLYFQIEIKNIQIRSIRSYHAGAHDPLPMEEVTFTYEQIKWTWLSQKGNVEATWQVPTG